MQLFTPLEEKSDIQMNLNPNRPQSNKIQQGEVKKMR